MPPIVVWKFNALIAILLFLVDTIFAVIVAIKFLYPTVVCVELSARMALNFVRSVAPHFLINKIREANVASLIFSKSV